MEVNNNKIGDNPKPTPETSNIKPSKDVPLSKEMIAMENRLKESLKTMIEEMMNKALKPIQESIDKLQATQSTLETHEKQIIKLQKDNAALTEEIVNLKTEMHGIHAKLNKLEDKSLECNLIFHGIEEHSTDDQEARTEKVYKAIANTIN